MPRRLLIILIALAALIIPVLIVLIAVDRSPQLQNTVLKLSNTNQAASNTNAPAANGNTNAATPETAEATAIRFVARNFTETYGSGTNQNDYVHLTAAKSWGTKSFNDFLDRSAAQQRLTTATQPFHGIVTKALVLTISQQSSQTASLTVSTQRKETIDQKTEVYYQDLYLDLVKEGDDWKVNAASWSPR
ncbi:MAG: hypothetical protein HYY50_01410 [Candidatus Kerfeldbacteria bacterium]|nr:hypothetical protein [Candidatus Kerfeldbacteria bacterium]